MYAVIENTHGQHEAVYLLSDDDILDCDLYAQRFAREIGYDLEPVDNMPCGADYRVVLQEEPGSCVCWTSQNYMLNMEG